MKSRALRLTVYGGLLALMIAATTTACAPVRATQPESKPVAIVAATDISADANLVPSISQVQDAAIAIDGDLAEWTAREWFAVRMYASGQPHTPSADLDVKIASAFDSSKFYLAVEALDDAIETVDRSWRYGDGFEFTLVTEEGVQRSSYVYQYAFDEGGAGLLFRNGEYLLSAVEGIEFEFRQHDGRVDYEIALPFELLKPFNPFIYAKAALNLIYADRDGGALNTVMLSPDRNYDTEATNVRAGRFFAFQTAEPQSTQGLPCHAGVSKNFFRDGETIELRYAVQTGRSRQESGGTGQTTAQPRPTDGGTGQATAQQDGMRIRARLLADGTQKLQAQQALDLQPGLNRGALPLRIGDVATGNYALRVHFEDASGNVVSEWADDVFVLNQAEIERAKQGLAAFQNQAALEASLSNLEVRFEWLDAFYERTGYEDISDLDAWWGDVVSLTSKLEEGEPAVFGSNTVKRYAHRSKIDDTLQPYSVFLPEGFNPDAAYPLLVFLHGSGVDEQTQMQGLAPIASALGFPLIAPKARGLSDWYLGNSGEDVFECIEHFLSLFPNLRRERIFLAGFSMGGYGTWRLGMLRPDYFRGLIVISGRVRSDILNGIESLRDANIFVLHGAKDLAVPVDGARKAVEKLKALDANVRYIEVPEGGHGDFGDYDLGAAVMAWIRQYSE